MDVSIIVVNYNTRKLTIQCLASVFEQTKDVSFEVILVDNASTDDSCILIIKQFPQTILIEANENLGFGRANNLGAKIAKGKYLFFLNSDTILINNAVKYFFEFFESHPHDDIGALGSLLLDNELNPTHSSGLFPIKRKILKVTYLGYFDRNYFDRNYREEKLAFINESSFEVDYITGADLFILHDVFIKLNGFDPSYFMYYEDTDLQKRIKNIRLKCVIISKPMIIHLEGGSNVSASFSIKKRIMLTKSMFLYFRKHSGLFSYYFFRICYFFIRTPILLDKRIILKDRIYYLIFLFKGKIYDPNC
jgi:GT2 family glycosyltransferase